MTEQVYRIPYTPFAKQARFHKSRKRYRSAFAGTGAGKTKSGAFEHIRRRLLMPGSQGVAYEPTYPMVERILLPTFAELLGGSIRRSPLVRAFNAQDHRIEWANGAVTWFGSLEDPTRVEGPNLDDWWLDEARLVRKLGGSDGAISQLIRRLRGSRPEYRDHVAGWVTTSAPTRVLYDFFENPRTRDPEAEAFHWSLLDNPHVTEAYKLAVVRQHHGADADRFIEGLYARAEGLVLASFDPQRHVRTWEHGVPSEMSYGVDWGWTDAACLTAWAWRGDVGHGVDEFHAPRLRVKELADKALDMEYEWGAGVWWCDPSRPEHITEFADYGLDARPYKGKIEDGCALTNDLFQGDELYIDPVMVNWLDEADEYAYDPVTGKPDNTAGKWHAMDSGRYGIMGHRGVGYARAH